MYVTRPMSRYLADPSAAAEAPPAGPGSGFLVVLDEAYKELAASRCCGLTWDKRVEGLPFPQSRQLALKHSNSTSSIEAVATGLELLSGVLECVLDASSGRPPRGGHAPAPTDWVVFVPVVGHSLSSGRYYVVQAHGKHTGKVFACSKEEDKSSCCFCTFVSDVKPRPFDSGDAYQPMAVEPTYGGKKRTFRADAVAADGIPPEFLRKKGWSVSISPYKYELADDAKGVDDALRRRMPPNLDDGAPPVVVGKWYVPFLFVRADGALQRIKDQAKKTMFYEMTLEQSWEKIFYRQADDDAAGKKQEVAVTATVRRRTAFLGGTDQAGSPRVEGGTVWFRPASSAASVEPVGLDKVLWERMEWEAAREGWRNGGDGGEERIERVEKRDDAGGMGKWGEFACYVLLERYVLRRMDRSVALTCEFRHAHKTRTKWA